MLENGRTSGGSQADSLQSLATFDQQHYNEEWFTLIKKKTIWDLSTCWGRVERVCS